MGYKRRLRHHVYADARRELTEINFSVNGARPLLLG